MKIKFIFMLTVLLVARISHAETPAPRYGGEHGNGGFTLTRGDHSITLGRDNIKLGIGSRIDDPMQNVPGLAKFMQIVETWHLPKAAYGRVVKYTVDGGYYWVNEDDYHQAEARLVAELRDRLKEEKVEVLDSDRLELYAISTDWDTFLLPSFKQRPAQERDEDRNKSLEDFQVERLVHEFWWKNFPYGTYAEVLLGDQKWRVYYQKTKARGFGFDSDMMELVGAMMGAEDLPLEAALQADVAAGRLTAQDGLIPFADVFGSRIEFEVRDDRADLRLRDAQKALVGDAAQPDDLITYGLWDTAVTRADLALKINAERNLPLERRTLSTIEVAKILYDSRIVSMVTDADGTSRQMSPAELVVYRADVSARAAFNLKSLDYLNRLTLTDWQKTLHSGRAIQIYSRAVGSSIIQVYWVVGGLSGDRFPDLIAKNQRLTLRAPRGAPTGRPGITIRGMRPQAQGSRGDRYVRPEEKLEKKSEDK